MSKNAMSLKAQIRNMAREKDSNTTELYSKDSWKDSLNPTLKTTSF